MVERLREVADVTIEEAKLALDEANGDLLDALIILERQGKTVAPPRGGAYSDAGNAAPPEGDAQRAAAPEKTASDMLRSIGRALLRILAIGNTNYVDAIYKGETKLACPVTVFVLLFIVGIWGVLPLMVIGLFFGWKFRLRGKELGRDDINSALESAETAADSIKTTVKENAAKNAKSKAETK